MSMFEDSLAPRTQYDVNFSIGDIAVRVHPYFWLSTGLLGLGKMDRPFRTIVTELLAWMAVVFVSGLVHELGHVLMGRYFGSRGHIILTGFCGLAVGASSLPHRGQRNAVYLAGPGAGFLLAGVVFVAFWLFYPEIAFLELALLFPIPLHWAAPGAAIEFPPEIIEFIFRQLLWVNIYWGLVNLLPIWPLDGGQVCREICEAYRLRQGLRLSLQISLYTAAGFAGLALIEMMMKKPLIPYLTLGGTLFPVLFFGVLAYNSWQLLQFVIRAGPDWHEQEQERREPWEQDADSWKRG